MLLGATNCVGLWWHFGRAFKPEPDRDGDDGGSVRGNRFLSDRLTQTVISSRFSVVVQVLKVLQNNVQ